MDRGDIQLQKSSGKLQRPIKLKVIMEELLKHIDLKLNLMVKLLMLIS